MAVKKFLSESGFKHFIEKVIGKTDISAVGDGTLKGAVSSLNLKMELVRSHVGMIVQSTTLDTEAKVIAIYGGTSWSKIEGRFLLGASSSYAINSTGGEATHKLTISEMPSHNHKYSASGQNSRNGYGLQQDSVFFSGDVALYHSNNHYTESTGNNSAHNNMPPYRTVYIWERTK